MTSPVESISPLVKSPTQDDLAATIKSIRELLIIYKKKRTLANLAKEISNIAAKQDDLSASPSNVDLPGVTVVNKPVEPKRAEIPESVAIPEQTGASEQANDQESAKKAEPREKPQSVTKAEPVEKVQPAEEVQPAENATLAWVIKTKYEPETTIKRKPLPTIKSEDEPPPTVKKEPQPAINLETGNLPPEWAPQEPYKKLEDSRSHPHLETAKAQQVPTRVTAIDLLNHLVDIDTRARLTISTNYCLFTAETPQQRCGIRVRARDHHLILASLEELSQLTTVEVARCVEKLDAFLDLTFCGWRHRKKARASLDAWGEKQLGRYRAVVIPISPTNKKENWIPKPSQPPYIPTPKPTRPQETAPSIPARTYPTPNSPIPTPSWASRYNLRPTAARIRNMVKYHTVEASRFQPTIASPTLPTHIHVRQVARQSLIPKALKIGSIYVYRIPGEQGLLKIGYTTVGVAERLQQWRTKCGHVTELVYPRAEDRQARVKHVLRVEELVHAELKACRYRENGCQGCGGNHIEWFRASEEHVRAVIAKWTAWVEQGPYEERGGLWRLRGECESELEELSWPLRGFGEEVEPKVFGRTGTLMRSIAVTAMN